MNKFKCGIKPPNRRSEKLWGEVFSPYSEKYTRLVTNDKPSWCSIIHWKHSFWEAALRQPRNRSHFGEISLSSLRTSVFPKTFGGPLSPQNQNSVQRPAMQRGRTCGEVSTNSCCWFISFRYCFWQVMLLLLWPPTCWRKFWQVGLILPTP